MSANSENQVRLWKLIVSSGLEAEYERDFLGRIKSKRTKHYLKAEMTPELAQLIADTAVQISGAAGTARAALTAGQANLRRLLSRQESEQS